ncbi:MAG: HD domain-containing protein [Chloroflexota bacterium]
MPLSSCAYTTALLARALRLSDTSAHPAFVVGGFVRDSALGRISPDVDIAVQGDALRIAREVAATLGGSYVTLKEERQIARVVMPACDGHEQDGPTASIRTFDFVGFEGDVRDDLSRRDFTINAMAVPAGRIADALEHPESKAETIRGQLIDPYDGLPDLEARLLRVVHQGTFEDDPGRLLRAVRLAAEFGLTLERTTEDLIRTSVARIGDVSGERSREELLRLLSLDGAAESVRQMDRLGLLGALIPELEACRDVEQPTSHFWDVLGHSIQTVGAFEFVAELGDWVYGNEELHLSLPSRPGFRSYLDDAVSPEASHATLIKLACLLHDVAKPQTKTLTETGRARFLGHTKEGGQLSRQILRRLRFSQHETAYIQALVHDHLRPAQISTEGLPSSRAVYRFFRDTGEAGFGVLYLALADYLACRGPLYTMSEWVSVCDLTSFIIEEHVRQEETVKPSRLIDGNAIMDLLNIQPGPTVGRILDAVIEGQVAGEITTREEAFHLAREIYEQERKTVRTAK